MRTVAVYLRTSMADPAASAVALLEQRRKLADWLQSLPERTEVAREVLEQERGDGARSALADVIAWCQAQGVPLVVPRTEAIGAGQPFYPRIISIPVIVLPQPIRPSPTVIPAPDRAPEKIALYVGRRNDAGIVPIYLTNLSSGPLTDITVHCDSLYLDVGRMIPTNSTQREIDRIEPGTALLIENYALQTAGEYLDFLHISYRAGAALLHGVAVLGLRIRENQFIRLRVEAANPDEDTGVS